MSAVKRCFEISVTDAEFAERLAWRIALRKRIKNLCPVDSRTLRHRVDRRQAFIIGNDRGGSGELGETALEIVQRNSLSVRLESTPRSLRVCT